ncbi:uncharacterized protein LOC129920072 isoform X2 [Episyrphus balteatus]|nr:uncharacterized protein LOC129920072 isoform X2 [Episyrphus balteatus]
MGKISSASIQNHFSTSTQSHFSTKNNTRVIAQKGGLAILPCVVKLNSPATVSWIRRKDFQLLTVGLSTHSSDKRFLVEHTRHMGHWSLRIKSVREDDRGFYECQLSIYPTQSIFIELKVVEAVAEITGAPDLHIDEGSALRLECKLKRATENPSFVFWYHDNKMVNYDSQDGFSVTSTTVNMPASEGGNTNTNHRDRSHTSTSSSSSGGSSSTSSSSSNSLSSNSSHGHGNSGHMSSLGSQHQSSYLQAPSTSVLTIQEVHFHHAGNYTCAPSNARPASITVHVLRGEKPAAMQHANRSMVEGEGGINSSGVSSSSSSISVSAGASTSKANSHPMLNRIFRFSAMVEFLCYRKGSLAWLLTTMFNLMGSLHRIDR